MVCSLTGKSSKTANHTSLLERQSSFGLDCGEVFKIAMAAVQRVPSANSLPLSASACPRNSSATGANRASLALPFPRQPLQLNQNLLYVLHALSDAIGDGGR